MEHLLKQHTTILMPLIPLNKTDRSWHLRALELCFECGLAYCQLLQSSRVSEVLPRRNAQVQSGKMLRNTGTAFGIGGAERAGLAGWPEWRMRWPEKVQTRDLGQALPMGS